MLVDRSDAGTMSGDIDAVTEFSWQNRSHPWAHTWLPRAVASAFAASMWGAAPVFITNQLSADLLGVRWKRFLLHASGWNARP
jgi:hypothetical protein